MFIRTFAQDSSTNFFIKTKVENKQCKKALKYAKTTYFLLGNSYQMLSTIVRLTDGCSIKAVCFHEVCTSFKIALEFVLEHIDE